MRVVGRGAGLRTSMRVVGRGRALGTSMRVVGRGRGLRNGAESRTHRAEWGTLNGVV